MIDIDISFYNLSHNDDLGSKDPSKVTAAFKPIFRIKWLWFQPTQF